MLLSCGESTFVDVLDTDVRLIEIGGLGAEKLVNMIRLGKGTLFKLNKVINEQTGNLIYELRRR